jgi:aspartyl aminopeptidase
VATADRHHAQGLIDFIDGSPSPYHAARRAAALLVEAGFTEVDEAAAVLPIPGRHVLVRGGSLVAWSGDGPLGPSTELVMAGAHTDSPNLRIKPNPDVRRAGLAQLGVEVYGGALVNSWLDRDLGLSGRVAVRGSSGPRVELLRIDRPLLRIPQLAIHLDREINDKGLQLNKQQHLAPLWAVAAEGEGPSFRDVLAAELEVAADDVLTWDVMVHTIEPSRLVGLDEAFVSAPRIDNQLSCYAATTAMAATPPRAGRLVLLALFDHEEVGSTSDRGAAGAFLGSVLERVWTAGGGDRASMLRALASGLCVSADCAHATNPNYVDRHEPDHQISLNGGPVLKVNANVRYATDAPTAAAWLDACERAKVPTQRFVNRTDLACGSTIGPLTAAALGIPTVDVGAPQLAMHSARELCGADDVGHLTDALSAFLS